MNRFIKTHYLVIILAIVMGITSSLPYYLSTVKVANFQGVYNQMGDDVNYYRSRAKDVIDGHIFLSNPYLSEHKSDLSIQPWIPDFILAKPIGWLGMSVPEGFIIWNAVLAPLLVLLAYAIVFLLTGSRSLSFLGVVFFYLSLFATNFLRLPSPGLNFIFFLATLLFLVLHIKENKTLYAIGASVFFGLLFYIYPWYWIFYIILMLIFILVSVIFKIPDFSYKKYLLIFAGALCIGMPYFVSLWQISKLSSYGQSVARTGLIYTHFPSGIVSVATIGVLIFIFSIFYKKNIVEANTLNAFIFSGLLASIASVNQHVVTGQNLEFSSHYLISNMFFATFTALYLLHLQLRDVSYFKRKSIIFVVIIFVSISGLYGFQRLVLSQIGHDPSESYVQNYAPVFDWLNVHAKLDEIVFANNQISSYIPIYTKQNVYFSPYTLTFLLSSEETENRFIINHYFDTFTDDYVLQNYRSIFGTFYLNRYAHNLSKNKLRKVFGLAPVDYVYTPEAEIDRIVKKAKSIQSDSFEKEIKTYRVDYLIWDKNKNPDWIIDSLKFLKPVYSYENIIIYKVN